MDDAALIEASLELVAERLGDPAPLVYARLFAAFPELEALFVGDRMGTVRGNMLQVTLDCLLDFAGPRAYAHHFIASERVNHAGLGVPSAMFDQFYQTVIATFRDALGAAWTAEAEAAWQRAARALVAAAA
ncbi:MAG: globin [Acetobacteraceae bacterium]|nr:globin [Acetobacteraceae bacterium]